MSGKNVVRPQKGQPKENGRKSKNVCCKVNQSTQQRKKSTLLPGSQLGLRRKKETVPDSTKELLWPESLSFQGKRAFQLKCLLIMSGPLPQRPVGIFFSRELQFSEGQEELRECFQTLSDLRLR